MLWKERLLILIKCNLFLIVFFAIIWYDINQGGVQMKKGKLVVLALVTLVTLTGCGGKKLACTMSEKTLGIQNNMSVEVTFKDNKVDKMKAIVDMVLPDEYKEQKQTLIDNIKDSNENMEVIETKDGIRTTISGGSDMIGELNLDDDITTYEDFKKHFEAQGYTCK